MNFDPKCPAFSEALGEAPRPVAVDDTIMAVGFMATAGSKMLYNFDPLFDAEAVARLRAAGYTVAAKTKTGEFGLDALCETGFDAPVLGGAAAAIAAGAVDAALCVDANGCPRRSAAVCGTAFLKPTYGTVSRYGVIPTACSMEQIGVAAHTVEGAAALLQVIAGHDDKDGTSLSETPDYTPAELRGLRVFVPENLLAMAGADVRAAVDAAEAKLIAAGAAVTHGDAKELEAANSAVNVAIAAEACNNLSRYDGIKFGYRPEGCVTIDDIYFRSRSESFGMNIKNIILTGSHILSKSQYFRLYDRALRTRRFVREALSRLFGDYTLLLLPACGKLSYTVDELKDDRAPWDSGFFTAPATLTGLPALAVAGVQLVADTFGEAALLGAGMAVEGGESK